MLDAVFTTTLSIHMPWKKLGFKSSLMSKWSPDLTLPCRASNKTTNMADRYLQMLKM